MKKYVGLTETDGIKICAVICSSKADSKVLVDYAVEILNAIEYLRHVQYAWVTTHVPYITSINENPPFRK